MPITPKSFDILQGSSGTFTGQLTGNDGQSALALADLLTLTLTLYVIQTDGTIAYVNSRNAQNVLNANNVTVSASGFLTWAIQVADTGLVEALPFERHIALFEWTFTGGGSGKAEVILTVQDLNEV